MLDGEQKDLRSQLQSTEQELTELRQAHSLEVDSARGRQEDMERKVGDVHTYVCTYIPTLILELDKEECIGSTVKVGRANTYSFSGSACVLYMCAIHVCYTCVCIAVQTDFPDKC